MFWESKRAVRVEIQVDFRIEPSEIDIPALYIISRSFFYRII